MAALLSDQAWRAFTCLRGEINLHRQRIQARPYFGATVLTGRVPAGTLAVDILWRTMFGGPRDLSFRRNTAEQLVTMSLHVRSDEWRTLLLPNRSSTIAD